MKLHRTQTGILNKLLFTKGARYNELKVDEEVENNTFQFHLNKMITSGYVNKTDQGLYELTKQGKKVANNIITEENRFTKPRKISVHLYCIREKDGKRETLMYTRKKHPFYGNQGFPVGSVKLGEVFETAAERELKEETNLTGKPTLFNVTHYLVKDKDTKELLDDKLFFDFFINSPEGSVKSSKEGFYEWILLSDLKKKIKKPFNSIETYKKAFELINNYSGLISFEEIEQFTSEF